MTADVYCGQCGKELQWEEIHAEYRSAACPCGRRYSELVVPQGEVSKKLPTCCVDRGNSTFSYKARLHIDFEYEGSILQ